MGYRLNRVLEELRVAFNEKLKANGHLVRRQNVVESQPRDAFYDTAISIARPVKSNSSSIIIDSDSGKTRFVHGFRKFIAMFSRR